MPEGAREFIFSSNTQTGCGAYAISHSIGTGILSRGKAAGLWGTWLLISMYKVNNERCYNSTPAMCLHGADRENL